MTRRILTVDDSVTIRSMLSKVLTDGGYEVLSADNGQNALGMLDVFKFDMVITDLNMNVMGGLAFIREMRSVARHASIPIVVLTTEGSEDMREMGRSFGATAWVTKPFDPEKLLRVANLLCPLESPAKAPPAVANAGR